MIDMDAISDGICGKRASNCKGGGLEGMLNSVYTLAVPPCIQNPVNPAIESLARPEHGLRTIRPGRSHIRNGGAKGMMKCRMAGSMMG